MKLTGAEALIKSLELEGVEVIFGIPGGAIMPAYDPLIESSIRHILCRHELTRGARVVPTGAASTAPSHFASGRRCSNGTSSSEGAAPTRSDGLSVRRSSGKRASIAALRRFRASYLASEMRGASSR